MHHVRANSSKQQTLFFSKYVCMFFWCLAGVCGNSCKQVNVALFALLVLISFPLSIYEIMGNEMGLRENPLLSNIVTWYWISGFF